MEKYSQIIFEDKNIQFLIYYFIVNMTGFIMMGKDKLAAKKNLWRIKEKTFFIISFIGGSIGCLFGMRTFRHKTQKKYFYAVFWSCLILHVVLLVTFFI